MHMAINADMFFGKYGMSAPINSVGVYQLYFHSYVHGYIYKMIHINDGRIWKGCRLKRLHHNLRGYSPFA